MNITERDRLAGAIVALRPDMGLAGVDRLKSIRTWLSNNAMEWSFRDAVVRMCVCVIDTSTVTPARALTDGPWSTIARTLAGAGTSKLPGYSPPDPECGYPGCGVRRDKHLAHVIPSEIRPHEWEQPRPITPATSAAIAARRPEFHRHEESNS